MTKHKKVVWGGHGFTVGVQVSHLGMKFTPYDAVPLHRISSYADVFLGPTMQST